MRDIKLIFDRTFSKSIVKKLLWLVGFILLSIIILYFLGYIPSFYEYGKDPKSHGMFYDVMAMFIDQRNRCSNMSTLFSTIVDVVGLTIVNGLFIAVMTSILSRRVDMYEKGLIHYKMRGHFIIVGYNKLTLLLIKHLYQTDPKAGILLLTSQDVQRLRKKLGAVLSKAEEEQLVIYSGDMSKKEDIAALQAEHSKTVYILGETGQEVDSVKMDCVRLLAQDLNAKQAGKQIRCYVCFDDPDIYHTFLYADIAPEVKKCIHFLPFLCDEVYAKRIIVDNIVGQPIDSKEGIGTSSRKHVHVVIHGMNHFGLALAKQVAQIAHFPNVKTDDLNTLTHITFIDPEAGRKMRELKGHYESLFKLSYSCFWDANAKAERTWEYPVAKDADYSYLGANFMDVRWEFIQGHIGDEQVRAYLHDAAADDTQYLSLFLCQSDDEANTAAALNLPENIYLSANVLNIYVLQHYSNAIVRMLATSPNSRFARLTPIGSIEHFFSQELVPEEKGKLVNACYSGVKDMTNGKEIDRLWQQLTVAQKWSSMRSAEMLPIRLRSAAPLEAMMQVEHNRWNMEKLLGGYRPLTQEEAAKVKKDAAMKKTFRNAPYYAHLDICSWEQLQVTDPEVVQYDADVLKVISLLRP